MNCRDPDRLNMRWRLGTTPKGKPLTHFESMGHYVQCGMRGNRWMAYQVERLPEVKALEGVVASRCGLSGRRYISYPLIV